MPHEVIDGTNAAILARAVAEREALLAALDGKASAKRRAELQRNLGAVESRILLAGIIDGIATQTGIVYLAGKENV